jgi:hypothetical protein
VICICDTARIVEKLRLQLALTVLPLVAFAVEGVLRRQQRVALSWCRCYLVRLREHIHPRSSPALLLFEAGRLLFNSA